MRRGFSLVEIAIGLVIFGIILSLGVGTIKWAIKSYHFNQNRKKISSNMAAIKAYISSHKGKSPENCTSILPYKKDEWGKDVVCIIDKKVQNYNICALSKTDTEIEDEAGNKIPNVAVVIVSGSENLNIQTSNSTPIKIYPAGYPNVDDFPYDIMRKEPYDDTVKYVTLEELKQEAGCAFSEETLHIITLSLPRAVENENYDAKIYATGGIPNNKKYLWCYEADSSFALSGLKVKCGSEQAKLCNDTENSTSECEYLEITGTPQKAPATYKVKVTVIDNETNNDTKSYVITVDSGNISGNTTCKNYTLNIQLDTLYSCSISSRENCESGTYTNLSAEDSLRVSHDLWGTCFEGTLESLDSNSDCIVQVKCSDNIWACDCSIQ